jgi:single-stranded DNA-binding protein
MALIYGSIPSTPVWYLRCYLLLGCRRSRRAPAAASIFHCRARRLGRDAEAKTSKSGKNYLRLNVRIGDGDDAQWVSVTSFDQQAFAAADKLVRGARVYVEGSLKLDKWTAQDGTERHGLSCMARLTRLPTIGRNRPRRQEAADDDVAPPPRNEFHSDPMPF